MTSVFATQPPSQELIDRINDVIDLINDSSGDESIGAPPAKRRTTNNADGSGGQGAHLCFKNLAACLTFPSDQPGRTKTGLFFHFQFLGTGTARRAESKQGSISKRPA